MHFWQIRVGFLVHDRISATSSVKAGHGPQLPSRPHCQIVYPISISPRGCQLTPGYIVTYRVYIACISRVYRLYIVTCRVYIALTSRLCRLLSLSPTGYWHVPMGRAFARFGYFFSSSQSDATDPEFNSYEYN